MRHAEDDLPPSSLRGRLCEVLFSALIAEMIEPLMRRLGDKAELDDPIFGQALGLDALHGRLVEWTGFLSERDGAYDRSVTVVGADRDVTEGTLEVRVDGQHRTVPIAVLMERRREREVALRVYCATTAFGTAPKGPTATAPSKPLISGSGEGSAVPHFAADLFVALAKRDPVATTACFEQESSVRDAAGTEHAREETSRLLGPELAIHGVADNGQTCAVEVALPSRRLGLIVLQRGDSGLIRSLRIYTEI